MVEQRVCLFAIIAMDQNIQGIGGAALVDCARMNSADRLRRSEGNSGRDDRADAYRVAPALLNGSLMERRTIGQLRF